MLYIWIGISLLVIFAIIFGIAFYCYRRIFFSPKRKTLTSDEFEFLEGKIYEPFYDAMKKWVIMTRTMPHKKFSIKSKDGLTLNGKYYEYCKGAPIEIMFHGYRGNAERDLSGGVERCFLLKRNVLIVDQRACGTSDGHVTTFGIKERQDCLLWIDFVVSHFGNDTSIILTGISMGAATVMMVANEPLPANVKYIIADCGYTSPKDIIKKVIKDMKLPSNIIYPFVKLGAKVFGGFNLDEWSASLAVKSACVPILFIHGESDDFVPTSMSIELYKLCSSPKELILIPNAGHGLAYPVNPELYISKLKQFENNIFNKKDE